MAYASLFVKTFSSGSGHRFLFVPNAKKINKMEKLLLKQLPALNEFLTTGVDEEDSNIYSFICGLQKSIINTLKFKDEISNESDIFKSIDTMVYLLSTLEEIRKEYLTVMKGGEA